MGGPVDTFVVRLVLAMTVLTWGSVLLHDLVTPDDAQEASVTTAAARHDREDEPPAPPLAPTLVPPTSNATATHRAQG